MEQLFPMLRKWGATGVLIEYEDMFPYSGELHDIAAPNSYRYQTLTDSLWLTHLLPKLQYATVLVWNLK